MSDVRGNPVTTDQATLLRQFPHTLTRFLCYRPRDVVGTFVVDAVPTFDVDNQSVWYFPYRDAVTDGFIQVNDCILEVGTAPGKRDVGVFRIRGFEPVDSETGSVLVNETAYADVPIQEGMYCTVLRERRIMERKIRRIPLGDVDYEERYDYQAAYSGDNESAYPPIANVTMDELGNSYKPMGMLDAGEEYRTVHLSTLFSENPIDPDFPLESQWTSLNDFDFAPGSDADMTTIEIRIPAGFTEMKVVVSNDNFFVVRYVQLWAFTGPDDPLLITQFEVTKDDRSEGRDMDFMIWDPKANDVGEGCMIGYFEIAEFGDDGPPPQYIDQFIGWALQDSLLFRLFRSRWKLSVGGAQTWLNRIGIGAQTTYDPRTPDHPTAAATKYIEIPNNTADKQIHWILRTNSTALLVMNLFLSGYTAPIEGYTSDAGSIWSQLVACALRECAVIACDSLGSAFVTVHHDFLTEEEREAVEPMISLDNRYWKDDNAPEFIVNKEPSIGLVDMYGSQYAVVFEPYFDSSHTYRGFAPGIIRGTGSGDETPASKFLVPTEDAILQLRRWSGNLYARENNPRNDNPLILKGNYDVIEPAWGKPILITYDEDSIRDRLSFVNRPFLVKSVSVSHSNKAPFKTITWVVEEVVTGYPGIVLDVTQRIDIEPYPTDPVGILTSGTLAIGSWQSEGRLIFMYGIDGATPTVIEKTHTGDTPNALSAFVPLAGSPYYLGLGDVIDNVLIDIDASIYFAHDILHDCEVTKVFTSSHNVGFQEVYGSPKVQMERNDLNFIVAAYGYNDSTGPGNILVTVISRDGGHTWTEYEHGYLGAIGVSMTTPHVSPHTAGKVYIAAFVAGDITLLVSTDYGETFEDSGIVINITSAGLHVPYESLDDEFVWTTGVNQDLGVGTRVNVDRNDHGTVDNVSPVEAGFSSGTLRDSMFPIKTCDADQDIVVLAGFTTLSSANNAPWYSEDNGDTWNRLSISGSYKYIESCNIAGDDGAYVWYWGEDTMLYSQGALIVGLKNIRGSRTGRYLNIFGIPNTP